MHTLPLPFALYLYFHPLWRNTGHASNLTSLPSKMISPRLILEMKCRNLELANLPSLSAARVSASAFVCSRAFAEFSTRPPA